MGCMVMRGMRGMHGMRYVNTFFSFIFREFMIIRILKNHIQKFKTNIAYNWITELQIKSLAKE